MKADSIDVLKSPKNLADSVELFKDREYARKAKAVICDFGAASLIGFAQTLFPGSETGNIMAKKEVRTSSGKGPHFDVYTDLIDPEYPWIGVYNVAGEATVKVVDLSETLTHEYDRLFPGYDKKASDARRSFSQIAMNGLGVATKQGKLGPNTSLLLPQHSGLHIVHDIIPTATNGEYIKLFAKKSSSQSLMDNSFVSIEEMILRETKPQDHQSTIVLPDGFNGWPNVLIPEQRYD